MSSEFRAKAPYVPEHPTALAVYCSDGRFTNAVEELLRSLGHDRLDTLTVPGGPALLDMTSSEFAANQAIRTAASFLIRGHHITQVTFIAHDGCGYYRARMPYESADSMRRRQEGDLRSAARWLRDEHAKIEVRLFRAHIVDGRVAFAPV